ncbi:PheS-related mystery ligase SrmL [Photobacterium atrarenae]|uniref:Phenylalanyl-tRNA synthetase n=1 Tax=Photobacterium atrarenae TaxID=865757 RepID=A0ABY5GGQ1_9GAMM|nr:hypothetical protein [Photobacterium atrarenae]UTV28445.1 hypothetical protein NNL38_04145 [Photobacterium atrarenae]
MLNLLSQSRLINSLSVTDLSDPLQAPGHAMGLMVKTAAHALKNKWKCRINTVRTSPVVPVENNYDRLNYPTDGAARDARYTRYVTERYILRTQTSSAIPDILAGLNGESLPDQLMVLPGLVYRRDCIDRLHCAEPHQLDLWRLVDNQTHQAMAFQDLKEMIAELMEALIPENEWRMTPSPHPYTTEGVQIDALWHDEWVEVGECGLINPLILEAAGLNHHSGLAMGLGLDRLLMLRKNIPDIRLLRSQDHRVLSQMYSLQPYQEVSMMPSITRDLSLVVSKEMDEEQIGDLIRSDYQQQGAIEALNVVEETPYEALPEGARKRLAIQPEQKNVLLRLVIRDMEQTLTSEQANQIRNQVYQLLHQGSVMELAEDKSL